MDIEKLLAEANMSDAAISEAAKAVKKSLGKSDMTHVQAKRVLAKKRGRGRPKGKDKALIAMARKTLGMKKSETISRHLRKALKRKPYGSSKQAKHGRPKIAKMSIAEAKRVIKAKRGRGRPSVLVTAKLAMARKVLKLKAGTSAAAAKKALKLKKK